LPETEIPRSQPPSLSLMPPIACTSDFETTHEHVPAYDDPSNSAHSAAVTSPRRGRIGGARSLALLDSATSAITTIRWSSTTQPQAPVDGIRRGWQRRTPPIAPVKLDFRPQISCGSTARLRRWMDGLPATPLPHIGTARSIVEQRTPQAPVRVRHSRQGGLSAADSMGPKDRERHNAHGRSRSSGARGSAGEAGPHDSGGSVETARNRVKRGVGRAVQFPEWAE
jgi:hypothetical protein